MVDWVEDELLGGRIKLWANVEMNGYVVELLQGRSGQVNLGVVGQVGGQMEAETQAASVVVQGGCHIS